MKKFFLLTLFCLSLNLSLFAQAQGDDIKGFWKTVDEKTKKPQSIVGIYEYQGKYYGRIVATYDNKGNITETLDNPKDRAPGVKGHPYYVGLDFIWDLKKEGPKYVNGEIMDPEKGNIYDAKAWRKGNNLIVRGELFFFGRNQEWPPALDNDFPSDFKKPDLAKMTPKIPEVE